MHWGVRGEVGARAQIGTIPPPDPAALDPAATIPVPTG